MMATTLLRDHHRRLQRLLARLGSERQLRMPLVLQLVEELMTHLSLEDHFFLCPVADKVGIRVDKYREGAYVLFQFTSEPTAVKELERRLRVSDVVLKFLTVRIDQTMKRLEKRKRDRDKRAHRKATTAPPAPAQPSMAQQMMGESAAAE